jgi:hypothetical protein
MLFECLFHLVALVETHQSCHMSVLVRRVRDSGLTIVNQDSFSESV